MANEIPKGKNCRVTLRDGADIDPDLGLRLDGYQLNYGVELWLSERNLEHGPHLVGHPDVVVEKLGSVATEKKKPPGGAGGKKR